jgi:hypothetical protein
MRQLNPLVCICAGLLLMSNNTNAQKLLDRVKNKVINAADKASDKIIDKKTDEAIYGKDGNPNNPNNPNNVNNSTGKASKNKAYNKGGEGLITTPPNVDENLTSAEASFKTGNYGEARYAVQQAMLGVELQIGQQILKSLPASVAGLKKDETADQVASSGWGWVGLTIKREYGEGDKQLTINIANNAAWMQAINLYFNNVGYAAQSTGGQQNWKQTKLKGYRAVIEFDESSGYKLSVPLGQTSLLVFEGVNFTNEADIMKAANEIDVDGIKKLLGEK